MKLKVPVGAELIVQIPFHESSTDESNEGHIKEEAAHFASALANLSKANRRLDDLKQINDGAIPHRRPGTTG